jgi:glycosyltransferase involved in cell wall biosynthesis
MRKLSVVIITFNEERNIGRCLESIKEIADEIVVVDSFSTDNTQVICQSYNVKFVQHSWMGYSATKNFANALASNEWILSLDADEALSDELKDSIKKLKNSNELPFCSFNRLTNYCGKWIRYGGWYPDKKLRIFDRTKAQWEGEIHEKLKISEGVEIKHIKGDCLHYSYYSVDEHKRQTEKFSTMSANDLLKRGKKISKPMIWLKTLAKFTGDYIFKLGFLDGYEGFLVSKISAGSVRMKYSKLKELQQQ